MIASQGGLILRPFNQTDLHDFSALHADPEVMKDLSGPIPRTEAQTKLMAYITAYEAHGYARWAVIEDGRFAGYVGVMRHTSTDHPLGPHDEIGWRILSAAWGKGLATRAAQLALTDAFNRVGLRKVLAYTEPTNLRSQAVMHRLGMARAPELDFEENYPPVGIWQGLTWRITATDYRAGGIE